MTCIIGYIDKEKKIMYMGGDSAGLDNCYNIRSRKDVKVFQKENNVEEIGKFLVAFKGRLFKIEGDLQIAEHNYRYDSCGCGENYALGSIRTLDYHTREIINGEVFITTALKVAQEFSSGVRNPFNILQLSY